MPRALPLSTKALTVASAIVMLIAGIWLIRSSPADPIYEGRPLSAWVEELAPAFPVDTRLRAETAVRTIGTNAIPFFLQYLSRTDRPRIEFVKDRWARFFNRPIPPQAIFFRVRAVMGFEALGTLGHSAAPRLLKLMADKQLAYDAARAMGAMKAPEAFSLFVANLDNVDPQKRSAGIAGLGELGTAARDAVPRLLSVLLEDQNEETRAAAADALGNIGPAELVIPALVEALESDNSELVRICAASELGRFRDSTEAIDAVEKATRQDKSAKVNSVAALTLRKLHQHP